MTREECREKYEGKYWQLYDEFACLRPGHEGYEIRYDDWLSRCERLIDDIAYDGFFVERVIHDKDPTLRALAIWEIPKDRLETIREAYRQRYKEEPWATQESK